jgi:hypothetical protein
MRNMSHWIFTVLIALPLAVLVGCDEYGKVDQGRVIDFDKNTRVVTLIQDAKADPQNPVYDHLPPATYTLPTDPMETGAEPKAGMRLKLDTQKRQVEIFDKPSNTLKWIDYTLIDQKENVDRQDPLVYDKNEGKARKFPVVDRDKKTITVYSARQKILTTFSLPDEYFSSTYPDSTWDAGDEVRIYYKEAGKAARFMNISKTDIFKK